MAGQEHAIVGEIALFEETYPHHGTLPAHH